MPQLINPDDRKNDECPYCGNKFAKRIKGDFTPDYKKFRLLCPNNHEWTLYLKQPIHDSDL